MYLNQNISGHWECFNAAVGGGRRRQRYRLESPHSKPKLSAAGQVVVESLALIKKPNQPPADVLSLHITDFLLKKKKKKKKNKFHTLTPRQRGISRRKRSRPTGSTHNTCRISPPPPPPPALCIDKCRWEPAPRVCCLKTHRRCESQDWVSRAERRLWLSTNAMFLTSFKTNI